MEEFRYGRAEATEADRDYVTRLLGEQVFAQQIDDTERDRRLQMVVAARYVDQVAAAVDGLPPVVPSRLGQTIPRSGDRDWMVRQLHGHHADRRISQTDLDRRKLAIYLADTTFELAAAVYGLPPGYKFMFEPERNPAPIDRLRPGLAEPLDNRAFLLREATLDRIFKGPAGKIDACDLPAYHRAFTAVQARNVLGLLLDPPPRSGDLLTDLIAIGKELNFQLSADAGKVRKGRQPPVVRSVHTVAAKDIEAEAGHISAEFRDDKMLQGLDRHGCEQKFGYYLWRLAGLSAFSDPFFGPVLSAERVLLSRCARDAGWQVDWTRAPSRPPLRELLARSTPADLQAAVGRMISPLPLASSSLSWDGATAEVERLGFRPGDGRLMAALGSSKPVAAALRAETSRDRGSSPQLRAAGPPRRGSAPGARPEAPGSRPEVPGRRGRNRRAGRLGRPIQQEGR